MNNSEQNMDVEKNVDEVKKKKMITYTAIGGGALLLLIIFIVIIAMLIGGKPNKKTSEKLVNEYLSALEDSDGEKLRDIIDIEGYLIFSEEDEKGFDKAYKNKKETIKDLIKDIDDDDVEDINDMEEMVIKAFERTNKYYSREYDLKEISEINKSSKSKKIFVIKSKVKVKSSYSTDTKTLKLYVIKSGKGYKIVGTEMN